MLSPRLHVEPVKVEQRLPGLADLNVESAGVSLADAAPDGTVEPRKEFLTPDSEFQRMPVKTDRGWSGWLKCLPTSNLEMLPTLFTRERGERFEDGVGRTVIEEERSTKVTKREANAPAPG